MSPVTKPRKQCKARTASGKPCSLPAKPGGKLCATHAKQRISRDPIKRANSRAQLQRGRQPKPKVPLVTTTVAEYEAEIRSMFPAAVRDEHGELPKHYDAGIYLLANTRRELDAAYKSKGKNRLTVIAALTRQFQDGLSNMGLTALSNQKITDATPAPRQRIVPVDDEQRARQVTELLLISGALRFPPETVLAAREAHKAGLTIVRDPTDDEEELDAS